jgi:hypothetical protein
MLVGMDEGILTMTLNRVLLQQQQYFIARARRGIKTRGVIIIYVAVYTLRRRYGRRNVN